MMKTTIKIFTDSNQEKSALSVLEVVKNRIKLNSHSESCVPYHKGGYVCQIFVDLQNKTWQEMPFELIYLCQIIGRGWKITGNIEEEFDAWSNDSSVSGISSLHVQCSHLA